MKTLLRGIVMLAFYTLSACGSTARVDGADGEPMPADGEVSASEVGAVESQLLYSLKPTADAMVRADAPNANHGDDPWLWVDGSPQRRMYLTFNVPSLPAGVTRVWLAVRVVDAGYSGALYLASRTFDEATVTWNTRPPLVKGLVRGVATGVRWLYYPVTGVVTGAGTYTFGLATGEDNGTAYASSETTAPPQLLFEKP